MNLEQELPSLHCQVGLEAVEVMLPPSLQRTYCRRFTPEATTLIAAGRIIQIGSQWAKKQKKKKTHWIGLIFTVSLPMQCTAVLWKAFGARVHGAVSNTHAEASGATWLHRIMNESSCLRFIDCCSSWRNVASITQTQPATNMSECVGSGAAELTLVKPELECDGDFEAPADRPAKEGRTIKMQ